MRAGIGFDAHRFAAGRALMLGCVEVPYPEGLDGHSDADVLVHAIADALLGGAGLGDIGQVFPPGDEEWSGLAGTRMLQVVAGMIAAENLAIVNVDAVVIAERPKLGPYRADMRRAVAAALGIGPEAVSIKATTTDGMGFAGRGEGIAAHAIATLRPVYQAQK